MQRLSCPDAYSEIMSRLGNTSQFPEEYQNRLQVLKEAGSEFEVYMDVLDVSEVSSDILKQVIGAKGCYFIKTTQTYDLDFVWHNTGTKGIEFWGPNKNSIIKAMKLINSRIERHMKEQNKE